MDQHFIIIFPQIHAEKTENYFIGKNLEDVTDFQAGLKVLEEELQPEADLLNPDTSYLISVAQGLLYKVINLFYQFTSSFNVKFVSLF